MVHDSTCAVTVAVVVGYGEPSVSKLSAKMVPRVAYTQGQLQKRYAPLHPG